MPAKVPFLSASESLRMRWQEAATSQRVSAQVYVFTVLILVGILHQYVFAPASRKRMLAGARPYTYGSSSAGSSPGAKDETVGIVDGIFIYPIKSCAGVPVSTAELTEQGFLLDRRWMVVTRSKKDSSKYDKMSLKEEPRLTLIQPHIDVGCNTLRLAFTDQAKDTAEAKRLGETCTVLYPTAEQLRDWRLLPKVEMYGDFADGRVAELAGGHKKDALAPSEWLSEFLGYAVLMIHFDTTSSVARNAYPIFKPPTDAKFWVETDKEELERQRGIEFQDEYPLLIATAESLVEVQDQLRDALEGKAKDDTDGRGGKAIAGLNSDVWSKNSVSMARFRPNIVIRSVSKATQFPSFSEDSWERIWIQDPTEAEEEEEDKPFKAMIQLVSRCQRCLLTAVDPVSAEKDASVPLKLLNRSRMRIKKPEGMQGGNGRSGPCFGMYAVPLPISQGHDAYGSFKVGDSVRVRWRPYSSDDEPRGQFT